MKFIFLHYCPKLRTIDFTVKEIKESIGDLAWRDYAKLLHSHPLPRSLLFCLVFTVTSQRLLLKASWPGEADVGSREG